MLTNFPQSGGVTCRGDKLEVTCSDRRLSMLVDKVGVVLGSCNITMLLISNDAGRYSLHA